MDLEFLIEVEERLTGVISRLIRVEDAVISLTKTMNGGTMNPIKYVSFPEICGSCLNALLKDATTHPDRPYASVWCPHGQVVASATLVDYKGERVIGGWSMAGPLSQQQAEQMVESQAASVGCQVGRNLDKAEIN